MIYFDFFACLKAQMALKLGLTVKSTVAHVFEWINK